MSPIDRPKRMLVRTSLVAGSTVATLIGAQTLITIDNQNPNLNTAASTVLIEDQSTSVPQLPAPTLVPTQIVVRALPTTEIIHVAPSISIVRQSGETTTQQQVIAEQPTAVPTQIVIQPPAPVEAATAVPTAVPQQVIPSNNQQQSRPPRTHSSR